MYSLDHLVSVWVGDFDSAGHVPGHVNHGDDGLNLLYFIIFKPFQGHLVLVTCRYTGNTLLNRTVVKDIVCLLGR